MSLKAKILLSTSLFMVLVVGLLTLNLSIDAIGRQARERDRYARLVQRLVMDWMREGAGPEGFSDWDGLSRELTSSSLISEWVIVAPREETLHVFSYSEGTVLPLPPSEISRLEKSIEERRVQALVSAVYIPVETRFGRVYGARFRLQTDLEAGG
ncbi:MAG: hypothetical protein QF645_11785, partial [Planctomycetota bacterium]|nr:hypothetical protein [Planctomycetota bacterium]